MVMVRVRVRESKAACMRRECIKLIPGNQLEMISLGRP